MAVTTNLHFLLISLLEAIGCSYFFLFPRLFNLYKQLLISSYDQYQRMCKSVSLTGKHTGASNIVNCIRHLDDTQITNCLYTYYNTIRSTMIDKFYLDFNIKSHYTQAFFSNNSIFCNFENKIDQKFHDGGLPF